MENPSEKMYPNRQEDEQEMEMTPVLMAPPAYGSPDPNTGAGQLVPVDETHHDLPDDYGKDAIEEEGAVTGPKAKRGAADDDDRPAQSATRAEWDDYARAQGVDPDEFSSKEDLIEALS
jgi:hypothetical protein